MKFSDNQFDYTHVIEDELTPTWIAYKVRETYPVTNTVYWTQKLDGPFNDSIKLAAAIHNLEIVKRENRDVKDIRTLIEC